MRKTLALDGKKVQSRQLSLSGTGVSHESIWLSVLGGSYTVKYRQKHEVWKSREDGLEGTHPHEYRIPDRLCSQRVILRCAWGGGAREREEKFIYHPLDLNEK